MNSNSSREMTIDSIDVTIFEDFYGLDITLPYSADPLAVPAEASSVKMEKEPEKVPIELSPSPVKQRVSEVPPVIVASVEVPEKDPDQTCCLLSTSLEDHLLTDIPLEVLSSLPEPLVEQITSLPTTHESDFESATPEVIQSSLETFEPEKDLEQTFSVFLAAKNDLMENQIPLDAILSPEKDSDHLLSILSTSPRKQLSSEIPSEITPPSQESDKMLEQTISVFTSDNQFELSKIPLELISLPEEPSDSEEDLDRTFTVSEANTTTEMLVPSMVPDEASEQEPLEQTFSLFSTSPNLVKTPSKVMSLPPEKMDVDEMINFLPADIEKHLESTIQPQVLPTQESEPISILEQTISVFTSDVNNSEFKIPSVPEPEKDLEQTFSVFTSNLNNLRLNKTPSRFRQPLILFSPACAPQQPKPTLSDPVFSPVNESSENKDPQIDACTINTPKRPETPTDLDKTLVLRQISARTNQSPLYTPVTRMVSQFRNLALESPYPLSNINNKPKQETPKTVKEPSPLKKSAQHQRLEKVKLTSPLLRSPKFRAFSTKLHPSRSSSKVCNSNVKKSPTIAQYKANPPVNQGSRIPVLKLI